jgi:hypothetical protein
MPDFDANDDPLRLDGSGDDDRFQAPMLHPQFVARSRMRASCSCHTWAVTPARRVAAELAQRRRGAPRRACPDRATLPANRLRRRRRLWIACHGRAPGSPS